MSFSKFSILLCLSLFVVCLTFSACKEEPITADVKGAVAIQFNYTVDGQALSIGDVVQINGTAVSFEYANFYVGGIVFHPEEGDHVALTDQYMYVNPTENKADLTELDAGHYQMIQFFVGVDDTKNSQTETDFTSRDASDPLGMQNPSMHWGWNGGYKYIRIDGMVDSTGDGTPDTPLAFHLGNFDTYEFLTEFSFTLHDDIKEGTNILEFDLDMAKLFTSIDLVTDPSTHVFNDVELAKTFHANLANAITR